MNRLIMITALAFFAGCDVEMATYKKEDGNGWTEVQTRTYPVYCKCVDIEGHRYLITMRNGSNSYNASAIHAASCPCMEKKGD